MQSYANEKVPDEWRAALAQLQSNAPPMSGELAADVIAGDLGGHPRDLFKAWDPDPIAAASVGQVHRAITHDDRAVAVKVQYPGAADALGADVQNIGMFLNLATRANQRREPDAPAVDLTPLIEEVRERIVEEVDYRREADNQRLFVDYFDGHPFIAIPRVVDELCAAHVLTTELHDGTRFAEMETWSREERDFAGEAIFRFVYRSIFRLGAWNGDPHPGNYLFQPGGRVCFLDFGFAKRGETAAINALSQVFEAGITDDDPARFHKALQAAGFVREDIEVPDEVVWDQVAMPWQQLLADEVRTVGYPEQAHQPTTEAEKLMAHAFTMPPAFLILMRTLGGLQAILARTGARRNWRQIAEEIWPFTERAPSTELGEQEAAWATAKGTT
jgi:predicted unusual protein kinase regulating ubiquinone biosynthesis (AarF/ABC1/UbiB family)